MILSQVVTTFVAAVITLGALGGALVLRSSESRSRVGFEGVLDVVTLLLAALTGVGVLLLADELALIWKRSRS